MDTFCPCFAKKKPAIEPGPPPPPPPPKPCTPEQVAELCTIVAKEMMLLCAKPATEKPDEVIVLSPKVITNLRTKATKLREYADGAAKEEEEAPAEAEPAEKKGGMFGGMMDKAKGAAGAAMDKAGDLADGAMDKVLYTIANGLDAAVDKVDKPFAEIGKDLVAEKGPEILQALNEFIPGVTYPPDTIRGIVRGVKPWGKEELDAVPKNAIMKQLFTRKTPIEKPEEGSPEEAEAAAVAPPAGEVDLMADLAAKLKPICEETIKKHRITSTWNTFIENYNSLCEKLAKFEKIQLGLEPIKLDIDDYIVATILDQIGILAQAEEEINRASPAGKSRRPSLFEDLFGGKVKLDELVYKKLTDTE